MGTAAARVVLGGLYLHEEFARRRRRMDLTLALFVVLVVLVIGFVVWSTRQ